MCVEVLWCDKNMGDLRMLLTPSLQACEEVAILNELLEECGPDWASMSALPERISVADKNQAITSSRQQDIKSLWCAHEADVASFVASS